MRRTRVCCWSQSPDVSLVFTLMFTDASPSYLRTLTVKKFEYRFDFLFIVFLLQLSDDIITMKFIMGSDLISLHLSLCEAEV